MIIKLLPSGWRQLMYQECHDVAISGANLRFIGRQTQRNKDDTGYELGPVVKVNTALPYVIEEPV